jgi:rhomboid family protein
VIPIKDNIPTDRFPFVTLGLIVANFVVYLVAVFHGGSILSGPDTHELVKYGAIPYSFTHPGAHCTLAMGHSGGQPVCTHVPNPDTIPTWETVFTSMFMHASIVQILGNMIFLWIFGLNVEDAMGHAKFAGFYVLGGIAALALQVALAPNSTAPTVGAAGAISAVLGGYLLLYPGARVFAVTIIIFFVTVIEIPVLVMLALWFVEQAVFAAADLLNPTGSGGWVAYVAQLGGFGFGLLTVKLLATRRKAVPPPRPVY